MTTNKALISRSVIDRIIRCNAIAGRAAWIQNDRPKALAAAMLRDAVEIASAWVDRYEDYLSDAANDLADENDQQDSIRLHFASYAAEAPAGYHEGICETCDFANVRKRFTPASGWTPFFSADVRRWGPVTTWNAAQLGVLLDFICPDRRLTEYGLGDRLTEEIDTLASAALSKRITAYCCEDAA